MVHLVLGQALHAQAEGDVLVNVAVGEEGVILKHQAKTAFVRRQIGDILPIPEHTAALGFFKAGDNAEHGALAAAGRAQKRDQLSGLHLETNAAQERTAFVIFADTFNLEHQKLSSPGRRIFSIRKLPAAQTSKSRVDIASAWP